MYLAEFGERLFYPITTTHWVTQLQMNTAQFYLLKVTKIYFGEKNRLSKRENL